MSGSSPTPTGGSGGSGGSSGTATAAPAYNYIVTQPGNGYPVGTLISDAATLATLNAAPPSWAVRIAAVTTTGS